MSYLQVSSLHATIKNVILFCMIFSLLQGCLFISFSMIDIFIVCVLIFLFFTSSYFSLRRQNVDLAIILMHLGVCLHMTYMAFVLGWDYGFQYNIVLLISFYYINSFTSSTIKHIVVVSEILLYLFLYFVIDIYGYTLGVKLYVFDYFFGDIYYFFNCFMVVLFATIFTYLVSQNYVAFLLEQEAQNEILEKTSLKDPLTNLNARSAFIENINFIKSTLYKDELFYFTVVDIDFFKIINDKYGHIIGDEVLKKLANMLEDIFGKDNVCRWGGEEFVIFGLERKSDLLDNFSFINKLEYLKTEFANYGFMVDKHAFYSSISIGCVSVYDIDDLTNYIHKADECLYEAKNTGRNKIIYKAYSLNGVCEESRAI